MKKMLLLFAGAVCALSACSSDKEIGVVAHRGYWNCEEGGYSHNSIASLKAACEKGFWGTEFDVNMTSDEQLLVYHDGKIDGKVINFYPKAEFDTVRLKNGEPIPTLGEYLAVAVNYPKTKLVFELKPHETEALEDRAVALSVEELKKYGLFTPERVMFISFSLRECQLLAAAAPGFTVQYLDTDHSFEDLEAAGVNGIDTYYKSFLADEKWNTGARERGYSINVWTVNKEDKIRECIAKKVDMITTNEPELVRSLINETEGVKEAVIK